MKGKGQEQGCFCLFLSTINLPCLSLSSLPFAPYPCSGALLRFPTSLALFHPGHISKLSPHLIYAPVCLFPLTVTAGFAPAGFSHRDFCLHCIKKLASFFLFSTCAERGNCYFSSTPRFGILVPVPQWENLSIPRLVGALYC